MDAARERMEAAIAQIDAFVNGTSEDSLKITPERIRALSCSIQLAKSARYQRGSSPSDPQFTALCTRYRFSLERLREHLQRVELTLTIERARLLEQHAALSRTRDWQEQFSRTQ